MTRKAHVKRLYANDKDGNPDPSSDTWIDVMRIDMIRAFLGYLTATEGQEVIHHYRWLDDKGENKNPKRKTHPIPIYDQLNPPSDKPQAGDPDTITLFLVEQMQAIKSDENYWVQYKTFRNQPDTPDFRSKRKFTIAKIVNNDFGGNDPFDNADLDALVDWDDYAKLLQAGTTDKDQHLYHEIVDQYVGLEYANIANQANANVQDVYIGFQNRKLIDPLFDLIGKNYEDISVLAENEPSPELPPVDPSKPDGPKQKAIRVDPFQIIVNVSWGGLAVEFYDHGD